MSPHVFLETAKMPKYHSPRRASAFPSSVAGSTVEDGRWCYGGTGRGHGEKIKLFFANSADFAVKNPRFDWGLRKFYLPLFKTLLKLWVIVNLRFYSSMTIYKIEYFMLMSESTRASYQHDYAFKL